MAVYFLACSKQFHRIFQYGGWGTL